MIAINTKTVYIDGEECVQADFLATETPDVMPAVTGGMLGVKEGLTIFAGSTVWCADTDKKWILFDDIGTWVNSADTTEPFSNGGGGDGDGK